MRNNYDDALYKKFSLLTPFFANTVTSKLTTVPSESMDNKINQVVSKTDEQKQKKAELRAKRKKAEQQFDPGF